MNAETVTNEKTKNIRVYRSLPAPPATDQLEVLTWNLGYAGLGRGSDFIADGGKHYFPPSRAAVRANVAGIAAEFKNTDSDVYVLPEVAGRSPVNYWCDLRGAVDQVLTGLERAFHPDIVTPWLPFPFRLNHGMGIYSRRHISRVVAKKLPIERSQMSWLFQHHYAARFIYLPVADGRPDWLVVGIHLSAFDEEGLLRKAQLAHAIAAARSAYEAGHPVILAGDWNLVLHQSSFPHTTRGEFLTWLHPFFYDALPSGWRIGVDQSVPTVRTNERPYQAGENYTAIIDGFIVSPNVEIKSVTTRDLRFCHSDHQPVELTARRID